MLLTVMFAQPGLSSPTWNLLIQSQGSNLEARSTWWRPTTSHAHNQESKIKSHYTNSDKFLKTSKNHIDNTLFCQKFVKICRIYPKPQLQHFSLGKTVQKLVKLSKNTNPELVSAKENLNFNQLQEVNKSTWQ